MKTKEQKKEDLKKLEAKIPASSITIFSTFAREGEQGLSVGQMQELKRALRGAGVEYFVSKKSIMQKAVQDLNYDDVDIFAMPGSVGLIFGGTDLEDDKKKESNSYDVAKRVYEFSKKNEALKFFGAFMDGKFVALDEFMEIAKMPSREMLIAKLLGMLTYPVKSLAIVLNETAKQKA